ncbi:MAG: hypothetical protein DKM50_02520 [Candidatus Margulisiibacteriota bacterium]|nr:MAG: hypothetical protein A2X43_03705 [Candidatus Margulisbacteria bacterium GWD2_39_127]OGI02481.1 MAG: hypothetical protein A2X42_07340 [Candidatus Margulisbacteria bacterium GWF2_38_17]OGI10974.1 MAG: hypothetical protein A2X41_01865 [Candidatus Margulisbacteria bacterium GWE2_39_32]PZM83169.1 MAG: hypothetical protein DKM50_02520 [Candidatus Margulisiibacteriota bacterium]HAR62529.1 hypothetical protein [Candidatus Margulisiibacteriota bacterium]
MPKYRYSGIGEGGKAFKGNVVAISKAQAKEYLKNNSITVTSLSLVKEINWQKFIYGDKVGMPEVILFTRLLSGAIKNGMPLKEAIEVMYRQISNPAMKNVILSILSDIKAGIDMSVSLENFPKVFPPYYAPLVKAGEEIGDLPGVLDQISSYAEKLDDIKKEIKSILTYPIAVLSIGCLLVIVILVKIIPSFKKTFAEMGGKLPLPTIILQNISDIAINYWRIILVVVCLVAASVWSFSRTKKGKYFMSKAALKAPFIGSIITSLTIVNFLKTLSTLLKNGVPIILSLTIVQNSIKNIVVKDIVRDMRNNVLRGFSLAAPLHQHEEIFPPSVAYAIDMGEKSGNLGEVMEKSAEFYDKQALYELKLLSGKINPVMTMLIGGLVLWVAMAIYLPMFDMMKNAGH